MDLAGSVINMVLYGDLVCMVIWFVWWFGLYGDLVPLETKFNSRSRSYGLLFW